MVRTKRQAPVDVGQVWWFWFTTGAFNVDKRLRRIQRILPRDPRCKFCNAPFRGIGAALMRLLFHKEQSALNPRFCNLCDEAMRRFPGGAEVPMSMLFADIRGSTELSSQMGALEFSHLIGRFYKTSSVIVSESDGLLEKLAGDAIAAFWGAGFAGQDYVRRTIDAARRLSARLKRQHIPCGIGVHAGLAFFGAVGQPDGLINMTAAGEQVNLAARLASEAAAGEIMVSEQALEQAGIQAHAFPSRHLRLKGIRHKVEARSIRED